MRPFYRMIILGFLSFTFLSVLLFSAACAPSQEISLTLTMLPGTFTLIPNTPYPSRTPHATNTFPPVITKLQTSTPGGSLPTPDANATQQPVKADPCAALHFDTTIPALDNPQSFIGKRFNLQSLPSGITLIETGVLQADQLIFTHIRYQGREIYWIQKLICRGLTGQAYYEITDTLILPRLDSAANQAVTNVCYQGNNRVPFAIAYGTYDSAQLTQTFTGDVRGWPVQVQRAWQMTTRFTPLDTQGLSCILQELK